LREENTLNSLDNSIENLRNILTELSSFVESKGTVGETDTRVKVIDRILKEVLMWPEQLLSREDHVTGERNGFTDYQVKLYDRPYIAIEAKREGVVFELPTRTFRQIKISTLLQGTNNISSAIKQVRGYCDDLGIRFGIATNGYSWVIFRALRDDMSWRDGSATIFYSLNDIIDNFTEYWNLMSFDSITQGSLERQSSQIFLPTKSQVRIIDKLFNSDNPLERNRLHGQLDKFISAFFQDIADKSELNILDSCYVYSKNTENTYQSLDYLIKDSLPKFLRNEGTVEVITGPKSAGTFQDKMRNAVGSQRGELYLILGGIGCGKTTFIKRYFRLIVDDSLRNATVWLYISLLGPPSESSKLETFIWEDILRQLRENYYDLIKENRRTIKRAFAKEIDLLNETTFKSEQLKADEYERRLSPYLEEWQRNTGAYVPRLLNICEQRNKAIIICIDNVDQLPPIFQSELFLLAQNITRKTGSITILALREETYYSARVQKTFTAYSNQKFHISAPDFLSLIGKRLNYSREVLSLPDDELKLELKSGIELDKKAIYDFLSIIQTSVFNSNKNITRFIQAICFSNMRLALDMFSMFLISGATDVDKMLNIYNRTGKYFVPFHEFVKSVMLGDRRYYKESQSKIINLFTYGADRNSSHFTSFRVLRLLINRQSVYSDEGPGYIDIAILVNIFDEILNNREDLINTCNRLLKWNLIEVNTRSTESIIGSSHLRITSAGKYYVNYLVNSFCYLDLVLQDTPIDDAYIVEELTRLVKQVDNLSGRDEDKLERTEVRFSRVEVYLDYLSKEEDKELIINPGIQKFSEFKEKFIPNILVLYQRERDWIRGRLQENKEKYLNEIFVEMEILDSDIFYFEEP